MVFDIEQHLAARFTQAIATHTKDFRRRIQLFNGTGDSTGTTFNDPNPYSIGSEVWAQPGSTPNDTEKVFSHWVVQKWENGAWVDTTDFAYPGSSFVPDETYAKVTENQDGSKTYTIQLRAEYKTSDEEAVPTHIYWYGNGNDQEFVRKDENLQINVEVNVPMPGNGENQVHPRPGYTFKGWKRVNTDGSGEDSGLFLTWDGTAYVEGTKVAADEEQPYHDLYAVWEPIHYTVHFEANPPTGKTATGSTADETFAYDEGKALNTNGFSVTGYVFLGWATSANGDVVYTDAQAVSNLASTDGATVTLYAKWTKDTRTYVVHHYLKGTTTKVTDDYNGTVEADDNGAFIVDSITYATTYQGKPLTIDSVNPQVPQRKHIFESSFSQGGQRKYTKAE